MIWEASLLIIHLLLVPFASLMQYHVNNFIFVADILRGDRHELVDDFAEDLDVSTRVSLDARHQFRHSSFVLRAVSLCRTNKVGRARCEYPPGG